MSLSLLQYNIFSLVLLLPVTMNLFMWESPLIATIFGGVFFIFQCLLLGHELAPQRPFLRQTLFGGLAAIVLLLISSSLVYIVWDLSASAQVLVWAMFMLFCNGVMYARSHHRQTRLEIHEFRLQALKVSRSNVILIGLYLVLALSLFTILFSAQTDVALRSPWEVVPAIFWPLLFLATALLWSIVWFGHTREGAYPLVALHLFLCFSVAIIVYKLGYGYDTFIHKTSEHIINSTGVILPKTPYYLGQYSLIVTLHRLLGVSLSILDTLLVPLLAALSLPLITSEWLSSNSQQNTGLRYSHWLALSILFIPFSSFIVTTPQGLANLFFLWIILASFPLLAGNRLPWSIPQLACVAVAAALVHPLGGIPALIAVGVIALELIRPRLSQSPFIVNVITVSVSLVGAIIIPLLLWLWSLRSETMVVFRSSLSLETIATVFSGLKGSLMTGFMPALPTQYSYLFIESWWVALSFVTILVLTWLITRGKSTLVRAYSRIAVLLVLNGLFIAAFFYFPGIAAYESHAYASRLLVLALWSMLPIFMLALLWLYRLPLLRRPATTALLILVLAGVNTASVYASYPRQNRFERSRQFGTSAADFTVVSYIHSQIKSDYVVLANQSVSAAAIASYGFRTYYPPSTEGAPIFYYPVPTSSPLYNIYLQMVNDAPTRENAKIAYELTGANTVYFVLNNYWDNADMLRRRATMEADEHAELADGAISLFTFRFEESPSR